MKTGDIILNTHAGKRNPDRVIMVLGYVFGNIHCLSRTGRTLNFNASQQKHHPFLKVIGYIDLPDIFDQFTPPNKYDRHGGK